MSSELNMSKEFEVNNNEAKEVCSDGKPNVEKAEEVKVDEYDVRDGDEENEGPAMTDQVEMGAQTSPGLTSTPVMVQAPGPDPTGGEVDRLLAALSSLCTESNTDTVLRCRGKELRCHTAMLRARSPLLARLLEGRTDLDLDLEPGALEAVVAFMYRGHLVKLRPGVSLGQVVQVAARLQVLGLLGSCAQLLAEAEVREALEVLVVAETLGLEEVMGAAVTRVVREGAAVVRDPGLRSIVLEHPRVLLRLYGAVWGEEGDAGVLRACYTCGACSTGLHCNWCST